MADDRVGLAAGFLDGEVEPAAATRLGDCFLWATIRVDCVLLDPVGETSENPRWT